MQFQTTILDSLRLIVQGLRVSSREAERDLGISGAQLFVLRTLAEKGLMSINELVDHSRTHQSSVSAVVAKLAARKLILQTKSAADARKKDVTITTKGRLLIKPQKPLAQERLIEAVARLKLEEQQILAGILSKIVTDSGFGEDVPNFFFEESATSPRLTRGKTPKRNGEI